MIRKRSPRVKKQLLYKSREAALNAVQTFNNPLTTFKAETFIVLMNIAWMYLLHAYYRREGVEYRYYTKGPKQRKFDRTKSGAFKYWELERCLNYIESDNARPILQVGLDSDDAAMRQNAEKARENLLRREHFDLLDVEN